MRVFVVGFIALAATPALAQPVITAGKIGYALVSAQGQPAAPRVVLKIAGPAIEVDFAWAGPSGEPVYQIFNDALFDRTVMFQGSRDDAFPDGPQTTAGPIIVDFFTNQENLEAAWPSYAEPGTWTLRSVRACASTGFSPSCSYYTGESLAALFPTLTFHLVNAGKSDVTPPAAVAGKVLTRSVSVSGSTQVALSLTSTDDVSGVAQAQVCFNGEQSGAGGFCATTVLPAPVLHGTLPMTVKPYSGQATGDYDVSTVAIRDAARNVTIISDPAVISTLFGGHSSVTLTP